MASYNPYNIQLPMDWQGINTFTGTYFPNSIKTRNNKSFWYWERALFQRAQTQIEVSGLPDEWESELGVKDFFYWVLFRFGYLVTWKDPKFGLSFQPCSLYGRNFYYQPVRAIVSNPALKLKLDMKIGEECAVLKMTPDYFGIWDIISYYAEKLSTMDPAINMSIINNKYPFMLFAKNKAAAQAFKKAMDLVNKGEPAVVMDGKLMGDDLTDEDPWHFWERPGLKENYITTDQLKDMTTILNMFDNEIGIPTIPYEKKERMVTSEAESRQADAVARCTTWINCLNSSVDDVNRILGTSISFNLKFDPEEVENDGNGEADNDRDGELAE